MATVKITETLVVSVRNKLDRMEKAAIGQLNVSVELERSETARSLIEWCQNVSWGPHEDLRSVIPISWLHQPRAVDIHFGAHTLSHVPNSIRVVNDGDYVFPPTEEVRKHPNLPDIVVDPKSDETAPPVAREFLLAELRKRERAVQLREQYRQVAEDLTKYLRSHSTLNRALKEMPELEMYIPQEYLDRVYKKAQRSSPTKPEQVDVDRSQIASLGVAARLQNIRD